MSENAIQMIDIGKLHDAPDNFFTIDRIEELADTILGQGGVRENLVVRPLESGGYEIISGHRRKAAVQMLLDRGEEVSRSLPCLVQTYPDDASRLTELVLMNISTRQLTDAELWQSYEILRRDLQERKAAGEKFGRVRDRLADLLGVSVGQVNKLDNIQHHAIEPVVDAVRNGELSVSTANEIAKLDTGQQEVLAKSEDLNSIRPRDVKQIGEQQPFTARVTNDTKSVAPPTRKKSASQPLMDELADFVYAHYLDLDVILRGMPVLDEDKQLMSDFLDLLERIYRRERQKNRSEKS